MAAAPVQPPAATEQVAATPEDFIGAARQLRALLEAKEAVARPRPSSGERGTVLDSVRGALNRAVLALEETDTAAAAAANAAVASRQAAAAAEEAAAACARRAGACRRALLDAQGELRLESAGEAAAAEAPAAKKRKREIRLALMGEQGALSLAKLERKLREEMALRKDREEEVERLRFELGVAQANLKQAEDSSAIKDASTEKLEKCFGKNKWHGMVKDWALCVETARNEENMRWLAGQLRQRARKWPSRRRFWRPSCASAAARTWPRRWRSASATGTTWPRRSRPPWRSAPRRARPPPRKSSRASAWKTTRTRSTA